jgi:multidrug efflux system outer membrane protein
MPTHLFTHGGTLLGIAVLLAACSVGPVYPGPPAPAAVVFHAALPAPAQGVAMSELSAWWSQFDDPLVGQLVAEALAGNPSLEQVAARIGRARAEATAASAALAPTLDLGLVSQRQGTRAGGESAVASTRVRSLDASWEIDLFGLRRNTASAARARTQARIGDWEAARVSLAAEVAGTLVDYRACNRTAGVFGEDAVSREQIASLTGMMFKAGFGSPADGLLSQAALADARQRTTDQRGQCDLYVKALVALTGNAEPVLRSRLAAGGELPQPRGFVVDTVPAMLLARRPDVAAAEAEMRGAAAEINAAQAARYPRLTLDGSIGVLRLDGGPETARGWSIMPRLILPLFDGGRRRAELAGAEARYQEVRAAYAVTVRDAVRETEEALVRLDAQTRREADAAAAAGYYDRYVQANEERYRAGPASLFELEDARHNALTARQTLITVQQHRVKAWIALYKALGGGWHAAVPITQEDIKKDVT